MWIRDALIDGSLNLSSITFEEYLQVCYLALYEGIEVHNDLQIVHKGNTYHLHACLSGVVPPLGSSLDSLKKEN